MGHQKQDCSLSYIKEMRAERLHKGMKENIKKQRKWTWVEIKKCKKCGTTGQIKKS